jgi:hypothetical protein
VPVRHAVDRDVLDIMTTEFCRISANARRCNSGIESRIFAIQVAMRRVIPNLSIGWLTTERLLRETIILMETLAFAATANHTLGRPLCV